jgi:hypothetical protein
MKANQEQFQKFNQLSSVTHLSDEAAATCSGGGCESGSPVLIDGTQPQIVLYRDGDLTNGPSGPALTIYQQLVGDGIPNLPLYSMSPPPGSVNAALNWNDQVTFVDVNQGEWEIYTDSFYGGKKEKLKAGNCYQLKSNINNQVSSIRRVK